jgi:nucleoside-diphosphate-sugar epimerase
MLLSPNTGARTRGDVLVTGATGFLAMESRARLLEDTDRRVWALVRASARSSAIRMTRRTVRAQRGAAGARAGLTGRALRAPPGQPSRRTGVKVRTRARVS